LEIIVDIPVLDRDVILTFYEFSAGNFPFNDPPAFIEPENDFNWLITMLISNQHLPADQAIRSIFINAHPWVIVDMDFSRNHFPATVALCRKYVEISLEFLAKKKCLKYIHH
jgi:hypothetical protein